MITEVRKLSKGFGAAVVLILMLENYFLYLIEAE